MKRFPLAVSVVVLGGLLFTTAQDAVAGRRKVSDQWSAFAPLPMPRQCWTVPELEGYTKESHPFSAKFHGNLDVTMTDFVGDWDLFVVSEKGSLEKGTVMGASQTMEEEEQLRVPLAKGWKVNILACNYGGGPTAELSLEFVEMRKCELELSCGI